MENLIDEAFIRSVASNDDWYLKIRPYYQQLQVKAQQDEVLGRQINEKLRDLFQELIAHNALRLGDKNPRLDKDREIVDTIVIHHTSQPPGLTLARLNTIQLLNIYMPYYQNPTSTAEHDLKGRPITSNHLRRGKPVFWSYHWLLRMNGTAERLLPDSALGWHAANWDINCRSIAICLDNDYGYNDPSPAVIKQLAEHINRHYPHINRERIFGHKEVSRHLTVCPGSNFKTWKGQLLAKIKQSEI